MENQLCLHLFILQVMSESGADSPEADQNLPTGAPQVSTVVQSEGYSQEGCNLVKLSTPVPNNVFMGTLQGTLGFTTYWINFMVEDLYDTHDAVLHWKFTDIK